MTRLSLIWTVSLALTAVTVFGQTEIQIQNLNIDKGGQISWATTNEKANTKFEIEEFRWNKWLLVGQLNSKGTGNNSYLFLADTSCGLYKIRVTAKDTIAHHSSTVDYSSPKDVQHISSSKVTPDRPLILFDSKTKFEIVDQFGQIVLSGCDKQVDTKAIKSNGVYFLCFGNHIKDVIIKTVVE